MSSQAEAPARADGVMELDDLVPASEQLEPVVFDPASEWDDIVEDEDEDEGVDVAMIWMVSCRMRRTFSPSTRPLGVQILGGILASSVNDADDVVNLRRSRRAYADFGRVGPSWRPC